MIALSVISLRIFYHRKPCNYPINFVSLVDLWLFSLPSNERCNSSVIATFHIALIQSLLLKRAVECTRRSLSWWRKVSFSRVDPSEGKPRFSVSLHWIFPSERKKLNFQQKRPKLKHSHLNRNSKSPKLTNNKIMANNFLVSMNGTASGKKRIQVQQQANDYGQFSDFHRENWFCRNFQCRKSVNGATKSVVFAFAAAR